jgi:hypothetical protein
MLVMAVIFFRIGLYAAFQYDETEKHPSRDPEDAFLRVELDLEFSQLLEDSRLVGDQFSCFP